MVYYKIICDDAIKFLKTTDLKFDLVIADPPYDFDYKKLRILHRIAKDNTQVLIFGHITKLFELYEVLKSSFKLHDVYVYSLNSGFLVNNNMPITATDFIMHLYKENRKN